jgi:hypothetical protein
MAFNNMKTILILAIAKAEEEKLIDRYFLDTGLGEAVLQKDTE